MKKVLLAVLVLILSLSLFACSTPAPAGETDTGGAEGIKVDIFWYDFSDPFLTSVRNALIADLDKNAAVSYTMHDCENNQAGQTEKVETALTQGTDLLIVNIVTTASQEAAQAICDLAKDAGIPIIFFNREVADAVVSSYDKCVFVGTNADEAGYMQGEMIANYLTAAGNEKYDLNGDGEISYIMLRGEHGNAEAFGRTKYSVLEANRLLEGKGLKLVPSPANETSTQYDDDGISNFFLYANWKAADAAALMATAMTTYDLDSGDIEIIIANNDEAALGAIEALNEVGYNTGEEGGNFIPVFGVDASANALTAMDAGKMCGSILQSPDAMAECIAQLAGNVAAGKDILDGTGTYNFDSGVSKIRIAYQIIDK